MSNIPNPKSGSFLERMGVHYVTAPGDDQLVIGRISRIARNRFKWVRYEKPAKVTTTAKVEPKIAETHHVPRFNTADWAVKLSYQNALSGSNNK